jgi:hypothetical protein
MTRIFLYAILATAGSAVVLPAPFQESGKTIALFNGKDLAGFTTWLVDLKRSDPDRVFSVVDAVDGAPAIRISGERWGGLITKEEYSDYRLVVEFRWGLLTWGARKDRTKDSGILLHCEGPEGNYAKDFNGPWMKSIEFQIIQGGVGDIILVAGYDKDGNRSAPRLTSTASKDRDGETIFDPNAPAHELQGGRINWLHRDVDWKDVLGFRGSQDVEGADGQWTHAEIVCDGDSIQYFVNGRLVNGGTRSSLRSGRILLQSEGAEIFFRKVELTRLR